MWKLSVEIVKRVHHTYVHWFESLKHEKLKWKDWVVKKKEWEWLKDDWENSKIEASFLFM